MANLDVLQGLAEPIVAELGAELYDLEFNGGVLKLTVTKSGGIDLDTIGEITSRLSRQLDLDDPIPGRYTLEVTSPGLERTLRLPAHWAAAAGELVRVKLKPFVDGERRVEGTITAADDTTATIDADGTPITIELDHVDRARTVFVWGPQPKPGSQKSQKKGPKAASPATSNDDDAVEHDPSGDTDSANESENA